MKRARGLSRARVISDSYRWLLRIAATGMVGWRLQSGFSEAGSGRGGALSLSDDNLPVRSNA